MADALATVAIARRRRLAGWTGAAAGNWAEGAFLVGEWDAIEDLVRDLDAEGLLPADESANVFAPLYLVRAYRGDLGGARAAIDRVMGPLTEDFQVERSYHDVLASLAFASGDHVAMAEEGRKVVEYHMYPADALLPGRAALWLRDRDAVADALGEPGPRHGGVTDLRFDVVRAGLLALEGAGPAASLAYLAAEAGLRELGIRFELALALLEHATFLPDDASAAPAADEAREIFAALGATTLLARLEHAPQPVRAGPSTA
jgi:hypothetical protein